MEETKTGLEQAFDRLDEVLLKLEDKNTSLEESFQLYQEGMKLAKECGLRISRVEEKVMIMNEEGGLDEF